MVEKKKARKRAAKPKAPAEEPRAEEAQPLPFEPKPFGSPEKPPKVDVPAEGTLIRMDGAPSVFVMRDGQRRPFANADAFNACGFGWNDIVVLSPKKIVPIPIGPPVVRKSDL